MDGAELEDLRGPLTSYCYRMLGAAAEAEDAVQETLLRAYQHRESYDPRRARLTTWVHRIAHNVCVDEHRAARRRALPVDLVPEAVPGAPLPRPLDGASFVDPMPGSRVVLATDPADRLVERESVRLAFLVALQHLTPPQRSALILRDVLRFTAAETADILGWTTAAANGALQRARERLGQLNVERGDRRHRVNGLARADDAETGEVLALLARYVDAFERHDVDALIAVLHEDAVTSMPPFAWWIRGGAAIAALNGASEHCALDRLVVVDVGGRPGLAQYHPDAAGVLRPFALIDVTVRDGRIGELVTFLDAATRFAEFGLPDHFDASAVSLAGS